MNDCLEIFNTYNRFETCWKQDDGKEQIRLYLKDRMNEELLLCLQSLEVHQEIIQYLLKHIKELDSNNINLRDVYNKNIVNSFYEMYNNFVIDNCSNCINIDFKLREKFNNLHCIIQNYKSIEKSLTFEILENILTVFKQLHIKLVYQFKTEIFPNLKRTERFQTFVLSKVIEFSQQKDEDVKIDLVLKANDLEEYCKLFQKKKLVYMSQLHSFEKDSFRELGIKKLGHILRLTRIVKQHFVNNSNFNQ
ncbi:hypothetical protein ABK040_002970 [Willaertia magna]